MRLEIQDLKKRFEPTIPVLDGLDLAFPSAGFAAVLGPSGCGKTTLLRIVAGLERADSGRVLFDGEVIADPERRLFLAPEKRRVGMVFQSYAVWPHLDVFENVAFPLRVARRGKDEIRRRVLEGLERVHLDGLEKRHPAELSGGQQQRVALARALVQAPRLLLLDEPLSNLDANLRGDLRRMIRELQEESGITSLLVTHDWADARALATDVIVLDQGQVVQRGTPEELLSNPASDFVRSVTG
jgi:iron(III) transport system ATP-binding protein